MRSISQRILLAGLLVGTFAAMAAAQTKLYLAEYNFNNPRLYRMGLDGSNVEQLNGLIPAGDWLTLGLGFEPATQQVYWAHANPGTARIAKANLNGSGYQIVASGFQDCQGPVFDWANGKIYFSDWQSKVLYVSNTDGTGIAPIIATNEIFGRPAINEVESKLYFGNFAAGTIERCDFDGSNREVVFSDNVIEANSISFDHMRGKIYWIDRRRTTNYLARADMDGSNGEILVDFPDAFSGLQNIQLDLKRGKMYWYDETTSSEQGVWIANLDGSEATRIFTSPSGWRSGAILLVEDPDNDPLSCTVGTVDLLNNGPTDVLFVNGSAGGLNREVTVNDGVTISATIERAPAGGSAKFLIHGNIGRPSPGTVIALPANIGDACFPILFENGGNPVVIANNAGRRNRVGASMFFGTSTPDPARAPTTFMERTSDPNLPPGTILTLQGALIDPGTVATLNASATNAVTIVVQ